MRSVSLMCRIATTFGKAGELDEDAFRQFVGRFIESKLGVYLGSGGSGEGHALTFDELRRIYAIGVAECKGKIPVFANPPEQHTARVTIEHARIAAEAGVDGVNVYALAGWHSMQPTDRELRAYFDAVLTATKIPVVLAAQSLVGYTPKASLLADLCRRYPHVTGVNLTGVPESYFIELKAMVDRDVIFYVPVTGSITTLALGAQGLLGTEGTIIPKTYRRYIDCYEQGRSDELVRVYEDIHRYLRYVKQWTPGNPRWIKMAMKVLKLPGGEGGLREPYQMPPREELERFAAGLIALDVPEINEMAGAAGLPGAARSNRGE